MQRYQLLVEIRPFYLENKIRCKRRYRSSVHVPDQVLTDFIGSKSYHCIRIRIIADCMFSSLQLERKTFAYWNSFAYREVEQFLNQIGVDIRLEEKPLQK